MSENSTHPAWIIELQQYIESTHCIYQIFIKTLQMCTP